MISGSSLAWPVKRLKVLTDQRKLMSGLVAGYRPVIVVCDPTLEIAWGWASGTPRQAVHCQRLGL
jgi:hypothetical protein